MLRACLQHLESQTRRPDQVIVVDASSNEQSAAVCAAFPEIERFPLPRGRHRMPASRNLALHHATGDVVAFLDDDSMAQPGWLEALLSAYEAPGVGGAGGRVLDPNDPPLPDPTAVGRLTADGRRIDNFGADLEAPIDVDRVRGCNMSFRRVLVAGLGGFDEGFTGSNVHEASDMCLRVRAAGHRIRFVPYALVEHLSAPREAIPRDPAAVRTQFYLARNTTYLLLKHLGPRPRIVRRLYLDDLLALPGDRPKGWLGIRWMAAHVAGKLVGTIAAMGPRRIDRSLRGG